MFIRTVLLDRFLACMKPASITLRPPCAGVFFVLNNPPNERHPQKGVLFYGHCAPLNCRSPGIAATD